MTSMLFHLQTPFKPAGDQPQAIEKLLAGVQAGETDQTLLGVTGSGKTFTMANVIARCARPTLILAPNKTLAAQLYGEMKAFFPKNAVEYFVSYYDYYQPEAYVPASDTYIAKDAAINEQIEQMRLSATKAVLERSDVVIVATVSAIYGLGDPRAYLQMVLHLSRGERINQREILRRLAELQYSRNDIAFERSTYRVRGEVIDVYPADSAQEAIRIGLMDDEIEILSFFNPLTGELVKPVSRVTIYPKSHYVTPRETVLNMIQHIRRDLKKQLQVLREQNKLVEVERLSQRTTYDMELLKELGYCQGIENYSRYLSGRVPGEPPPTLLDYFPKQYLLMIDESHVTVPQLNGMYHGDRSRKETLVEYGFRLPSALDNRPLRFNEFIMRTSQRIFISATPGTYEFTHSTQIVEQVVRPTGLLDPQVIVRSATYQVDDLLSEINKRLPHNERILVTTLTKRMAEELTDYLTEHGIRVRYLHSDVGTVERVAIIRALRLGEFDVLVGINLLREGLDLPEVSLVAILDADKEGFLRSEKSLIQTIGRAARHINGTAILYANHMTRSIQQACDETERRRVKQAAYNAAHHITPQGIMKAVHDVMEEAYAEDSVRGQLFFAERKPIEKIKTTDLTPEAYQEKLKQLTRLMRQHADRLQFEEAAAIRDQIVALQKAN